MVEAFVLDVRSNRTAFTLLQNYALKYNGVWHTTRRTRQKWDYLNAIFFGYKGVTAYSALNRKDLPVIDRERLKQDVNYITLISSKYADRIKAIWANVAGETTVNAIIDNLPERSVAQLRIQVNNTLVNIRHQQEKDMTQ